MIKKLNCNKLLILFLFSHSLIWILVPSFSNINLPLDTIEALAWGSNLDWGFNKHPPLSAFIAEFFFKIFGNQDWAYYLLSQVCVVISFYFVWKLSEIFLKKNLYALLSVLLLESIYFYNFTTPEYNVNICILPFWSMSIYYCWLSYKYNQTKHWIFFGVCASLAFLSKYLFLYLLLGLLFFFIFEIKKRNFFNLKYLIPVFIFLFIISPHILWLFKNDFITINYALNRTGVEKFNFLNHLINPASFIIKQIFILTLFFSMIFLLIKNFKLKINFKEKNLFFLLCINILPILLILVTSIITGAKIRTMWMTPFYLFFGLFFIYTFRKQITFKRISFFSYYFLFLFFVSPIIYSFVSISNKDKRTDYPGYEISYLVQKKWDQNFSNNITIVIGDEWSAGNLSYHLKSRPKWFNDLKKEVINNLRNDQGVIYVGNPKILKSICPGVFGTIKPTGYCMIGRK